MTGSMNLSTGNEFPVEGGKVRSGRLQECVLKLGGDVDLRNAVPDRLANLAERSSGAAVQHERHIRQPFGDGPAAGDVELRFAPVIAVGGPDGDGQRVDSAAEANASASSGSVRAVSSPMATCPISPSIDAPAAFASSAQ